MTTPTYLALDEAKIGETLKQLRNRIGERFPGSGLRDVAGELISIGKEVSECVAYIRAPNWNGPSLPRDAEPRLSTLRRLEIHEAPMQRL